MINHFIKYPKMARKNHNNWSSTFVSLTASVLLLVGGCDGGIFGTGDGDNPPIVVPVGTEDLGENPVVTDGMQNLPDNVGLSFITSDSIGTFNNNENATNRSDAQIKLINASPNENLGIIAINNNMIEAPLIPLPGITSTNRVSGYLTLENPANAITLFTAADATREEFSMPIASIDPITLAAGSATT
nr:hypothetical protein [Granulosicoccus sp.]